MAKKRSPIYKEGSELFQSRIPADQLSQQASANAAVNIDNKSPSIESVVLPSFDARPINGRDFYASGGTIHNVPIEEVEGGTLGAYFNYRVPNGYRAILRGYKYSLNPIVNSGEDLHFDYREIIGSFYVGGETVSVLQPNGIVVTGFDNLQHGQSQSYYQPCYILADSNETITFVLRFSGDYKNLVAVGSPDLPNVPLQGVQIEFYGNILQNTGVPLNFEPGLARPVPVKAI